MPHMTMPWLAVAVLQPVLRRHGMRLSDLAASLHHATAGRHEPVPGLPKGREVGFAEFKTARTRPGDALVELQGPDHDPFAPPGSSTPFPDLPEMWGGVEIEGGERRLRLSGIALHDDLVVLPISGRGMAILRGSVPDTTASRMSGKPLRDLVSHPLIDGLPLVVRRLREAGDDELAHAGWTGPALVATFSNPKTDFRVEYRV